MTEAQFSKEYKEAVKERRIWQKDDKEFERLANNELLADLDPNLPETNDGSLAASLFKLPKRVVPNDLSGSPRALDRSDKWINEFAKIEWEKNIIPNANTQAPFNNKWKDAVRKAAIYGSVPLITITTELPDGSTSSDFIVAYPADCTLEPGKVSDTDSDIIYWDVYFSDSQLDNLIEQHKKRVDESRVDIGGHLVRIVECTCREIVSDLLNELAKGEPFSASYYMQSEQMMFSLRSESGGVNVAEVAEGYGGGGHRNSAGFCIPRSGAIKV